MKTRSVLKYNIFNRGCTQLFRILSHLPAKTKHLKQVFCIGRGLRILNISDVTHGDNNVKKNNQNMEFISMKLLLHNSGLLRNCTSYCQKINRKVCKYMYHFNSLSSFQVIILFLCLSPITGFALPKGECLQPKPETDLRHCNFSEKNLANIDLHGVDLSHVDLSNSKMADCNLSGAILIESQFKWTDLTGCNLSNVNLKNADLFHAHMDATNLTNANLSGASFSGTDLNEAIGDNANFSNAFMHDLLMEESQFRYANFSNVRMFRAVLISSDFSGSRFQNAKLTGVSAEDVNFSNTDLSGTKLNNARLEGAKFDNAIFSKTDFNGTVDLSIEIKKRLNEQGLAN